jgi:hypothetical protein
LGTRCDHSTPVPLTGGKEAQRVAADLDEPGEVQRRLAAFLLENARQPPSWV